MRETEALATAFQALGGLSSVCLSSFTPPATLVSIQFLECAKVHPASRLCAYGLIILDVLPSPIPGPSFQGASHPQLSAYASLYRVLAEPEESRTRVFPHSILPACCLMSSHMISWPNSGLLRAGKIWVCLVHSHIPGTWHCPCTELVLSKCGRGAGLPCHSKGRGGLCLWSAYYVPGTTLLPFHSHSGRQDSSLCSTEEETGSKKGSDFQGHISIKGPARI